MSKPGERNRLNEDHGRKQSSSKLVRFPPSLSLSSILLMPALLFVTGIFILDPDFKPLTLNVPCMFVWLFVKWCGSCYHSETARCSTAALLSLSFQVWRTAWTVILSAARRRSGVTTVEVTSWSSTRRWRRENTNCIATMDRLSTCP